MTDALAPTRGSTSSFAIISTLFPFPAAGCFGSDLKRSEMGSSGQLWEQSQTGTAGTAGGSISPVGLESRGWSYQLTGSRSGHGMGGDEVLATGGVRSTGTRAAVTKLIWAMSLQRGCKNRGQDMEKSPLPNG